MDYLQESDFSKRTLDFVNKNRDRLNHDISGKHEKIKKSV